MERQLSAMVIRRQHEPLTENGAEAKDLVLPTSYVTTKEEPINPQWVCFLRLSKALVLLLMWIPQLCFLA